jgi:glycosyltransferase involved in cell wall biosynthesis
VTTTDISLALLLGPQLEAFAAAGYSVVGVSAPGPFVAGLGAAGIGHVALRHATRSFSPVADAMAAAELHGVFRRLRPDIVHTHNPKPGVYGRLAARAAGVPAVVNTVHGLYATRTDAWPRRAVVYGLERLAAACSDAELVQNPEDLETLAGLGVPRDRLHLLGNGVDLDRFRRGPQTADARRKVRGELGVGDGTVVVGAVGRLVWEKGYAELFAAASELRRREPGGPATGAGRGGGAGGAGHPEIAVVVAGPTEPGKADGIGAPEMATAEAAGVRFLGHRADVEDLYAAFDIYVLASHREGFPRSAMEAAAMGLPVVATDIRGCRQVVDHEVTGLLVPARDPGALAAAVGRLAGDAALRAAMGAAAAAKSGAEFDQRRVIDTTLAVYRTLLSERQGRGKENLPARPEPHR